MLLFQVEVNTSKLYTLFWEARLFIPESHAHDAPREVNKLLFKTRLDIIYGVCYAVLLVKLVRVLCTLLSTRFPASDTHSYCIIFCRRKTRQITAFTLLYIVDSHDEGQSQQHSARDDT